MLVEVVTMATIKLRYICSWTLYILFGFKKIKTKFFLHHFKWLGIWLCQTWKMVISHLYFYHLLRSLRSRRRGICCRCELGRAGRGRGWPAQVCLPSPSESAAPCWWESQHPSLPSLPPSPYEDSVWSIGCSLPHSGSDSCRRQRSAPPAAIGDKWFLIIVR